MDDLIRLQKEMTRLLAQIAPAVEPENTLMGLFWQIDNAVVGLQRSNLTKRAADGFAASPEFTNAIAENTGSPKRGVYRRR